MAYPHDSLAPCLRPRAVFIACQGFIVALAVAQTASPLESAASAPAAQLPRVTVTAPAPAAASIAGWGDQPIDSLPLQATVIGRERIDDAGARRLADLLKFDASATDAYNSPGYWDAIAVRGYALDPRFNYRREGLPISAETAIPLENKERLEILKGTSGIQAGTSAPGGLVNFIVKRPTAGPLASATLSTGERGSLGVSIDWSGGKRDEAVFSHRIAAAYEDRRPQIERYGHLRRGVLAWAGDWQLTRDTLVQAEVESSRQIGASLPAYSLTGGSVPAPRSPDNFVALPWALPNTFGALTGSLKLDHRLAGGWRWTSVLGAQRLKSDDRLPFAFGCTDTNGDYYADRYCPSGRFDLYDFRSDDERRRTDAAETALQGQLQTGSVTHDLRVGLQASRQRVDVNRQAGGLPVGSGNIDGDFTAPADPTLNVEGTDRRERSIEVFAQDAIDWGAGLTSWIGLRQTRLRRESVRTDGTQPVAYAKSLVTPWLAMAYEWQPRQSIYLSWGQGAESNVVPNRSFYTDPGQPLAVQKSRQWELGLRGAARVGASETTWSLAAFDIDRPYLADLPPAYAIEGSARHRGLDASGSIEQGAFAWDAGLMLLDAERRDASDPAANGRRPVNVPRHTARMQARWQVPAMHGLELGLHLRHEGRRNVLDDGSIELPSWTRTDLGAQWRQSSPSFGTLTWRLGLDNVFDRKAWKESPTQFGHVYLYPLEARTLRLSLQATL